MKLIYSTIASMAASLALNCSLPAKDVSFEDCPQKVRMTINQERNGGDIDGIEFKPNRNLYFVDINFPGDHDMNLTIQPNGTLRKKVQDIRTSDIPATVRSAARKLAPGGSIDNVIRTEIPGKITFELEIDDSREKDLIAVIRRDGKVISTRRVEEQD